MSKKFSLRRFAAGILFAMLVSLVIYDSGYHLDSQRVEIMRKHHSAQRNWSAHYDQRNVFNNSSFRYQDDFEKLAEIIKPQSLVLSDLATSYYASALLPVYVPNVHAHHGRRKLPAWKVFLDKRFACYMEFEENRVKVFDFLGQHPDLDYVLVNRDTLNINLRRDCLAFRSHTLTEQLPRFASLIWEGEYLDLYSFHPDYPHSAE